MVPAVAYLVLARGTGGDQRTTSWSVNAIETYTNIGRPRAKQAIAALEGAGLIRVLQKGSRPRYFITPATKDPGVARTREEPDWIWLPNTLIDGADGEVPPVERVRQARNITALQLFIDLYHAHNLADDGGVDWRPPNGIRERFKRLKIGETHEYNIWGFYGETVETWSTNPIFARHSTGKDGAERFWDAWRLLKLLGLVDTVAHLVETDKEDGEPIHPLADGNGEPGEQAVLQAAVAAATAMMTEEQVEWATHKSFDDFMVPVRKHRTEVQVLGRERPQSGMRMRRNGPSGRVVTTISPPSSMRSETADMRYQGRSRRTQRTSKRDQCDIKE
jgi:hypothetical protein